MISDLKRIFTSFKTEGSFVRNFSYLFSARIATIILSLVVTPILTRLYSPEAYGYFSIFNAVAMNFTILCCLSYDTALVIVKGEKWFYNLFIGCFFLSLFFLFFLSLSLLATHWVPFLNTFFDISPSADKLKLYLLIILGAFIYSNAQLLAKWNVRRDKFSLASKIWVSNQISNRSLSLLLGFYYSAPIYGLIMAELIGKLISILLNLKTHFLKEWKEIKKSISIVAIKEIVTKLKSYPKYILPDRYINLLVNQAPIFIITAYFGTEILGNFSLVTSIISMPILLISNTMSSVFLKKASDLRNDKNSLKQFIIKTAWLLTLLTLPAYFTLILFSDIIFPFIFGSEWEVAGEMAGIIAFYTIVQLYQVFAMPLFQVYEKEKKALVINSVQFLCVLLLVFPGIIYNNYILVLIGYGVVRYTFGWVQIASSIKLVEGKITKIIVLVSIVLLASLLLKYHLLS